MLKRLLWIVPVFLLLAAGVFYHFRQRSSALPAPVVYAYDKPERRDLRQVVMLNGTIAPTLSTEIRSEASGRIARVLVQPGDEVRAGQALVELDQASLQVQLDEARLTVVGSQLQSKRAAAEFRRLQSLAEKELVTEKERLEAEIAHELAENTVAAQQARVRLLETSLTKSVITAPYSGRVLSLAARPGMVVTGADSGREGQTLLELADLSQLRVEAAVNEIDVAAISAGQEVDISFESIPEAKASGRISFIAPAAGRAPSQANPGGSTGGGGASGGGRDYPIHVAIEKSHPRIRPGMTARLSIVTATAQQVLSVPITHVFGDIGTGEWFVFTRPSASAPPEAEPTQTPVTLGIRDARYVEVKSGIEDGVQISSRRPTSAKFSHEK